MFKVSFSMKIDQIDTIIGSVSLSRS